MKSELIYPESWEKGKEEVLKKLRKRGEEFFKNSRQRLEKFKKEKREKKERKNLFI